MNMRWMVRGSGSAKSVLTWTSSRKVVNASLPLPWMGEMNDPRRNLRAIGSTLIKHLHLVPLQWHKCTSAFPKALGSTTPLEMRIPMGSSQRFDCVPSNNAKCVSVLRK